MSDWLGHQQIIGKIFSITALVIIPFSTLFRNTYSNFLDSVQLFYILAKVFAPKWNVFSTQLGYSWIQFMSTFLDYCNPGDFSCTYGYLLSPLLAWIGICLFAMIIIRIIKQKWKGVWFKPFYQFYKGFLRWSLGPLTYYSILMIISDIQEQIDKSRFYPAIGSFIGLCLIIVIEIIYFTCIQKQDQSSQPKWINFMNHIRMGTWMTVMAIVTNIHQGPQYSLIVVPVLYDFYFLIKYEFVKPLLQRVLYILSQLVLIVLIAFFIWDPELIFKINLDFFGLIIIVLIELFLIIFRIYYELSGEPDEEGFMAHIKKENKAKKMFQNKKQNNGNYSQRLKPQNKYRKKKENLTSRVTSQKNSQKNSLNGSRAESLKSGQAGLQSLQSLKNMKRMQGIDEQLTYYYKNTRRKRDVR